MIVLLFIVSFKMENSYLKAIILMIISSLSFGIMSLMVSLSGELPLFEKIFFRNFVSLFVALIFIIKNKESFLGKRENRTLLILRSLLGLGGVLFYFYCIQYMNLADSTMLNKLSPFFVILFAALFLKEKLYPYQIAAILIAFSASLLIIKPHFNMDVIPALAGLASAVFAGAAYAIIRALKLRNESSATIVFYFSFISFIVTLPLAISQFIMPVGVQWIYLFGIGIFAAIGQMSMTQSYLYARASDIAPFKYLHVLFAGILGVVFLCECIDKYSILGYIIIFAVYIFMYIRKRQLQ